VVRPIEELCANVWTPAMPHIPTHHTRDGAGHFISANVTSSCSLHRQAKKDDGGTPIRRPKAAANPLARCC
jgi:hypothetical protein